MAHPTASAKIRSHLPRDYLQIERPRRIY